MTKSRAPLGSLPMMSINHLQGFASSAGNCAGCDKRYKEGEAVWTDPVSGETKADMCCGPEPDRAGSELFELPTVDDPDEMVRPADFMPRGRTAADRCDSCFQIPSASGACGCF